MEGTSSDSSAETSYSSRALALILSSKLPHPDNLIVKAFVEDAVDPELSSHYLLKTIGSLSELGNYKSKDLELFRFLTDWTTLLQRCACHGK